MSAGAKISCICVTSHRPLFLKEAIRYFSDQDFLDKELIILMDDNDPSAAVAEGEGVRLFFAPHRDMTLGERRNYAISCSSGDYIAQWDDDDWYHPQRLTRQYNEIRDLKGSVLRRVTVFDSLQKQRYISPDYLWEGTILVEKKAIQKYPYPSIQRGEDTPVIEALHNEGYLRVMDAPDLYTYVYHGENTWDLAHFENIFSTGKKL